MNQQKIEILHVQEELEGIIQLTRMSANLLYIVQMRMSVGRRNEEMILYSVHVYLVHSTQGGGKDGVVRVRG